MYSIVYGHTNLTSKSADIRKDYPKNPVKDKSLIVQTLGKYKKTIRELVENLGISNKKQ